MASPLKKILIVDDDPGIRGLLRRLIGDMGYDVKEAADAISALDVLAEDSIGLALVDIKMPGRDGVWLIDQIVTNYPEVPVVLATGVLEMDPRVTLQRGVIGYVTKPFQREPLIAVIKAAEEELARRKVD
jgi:DNA-binding NtrC family response regulator